MQLKNFTLVALLFVGFCYSAHAQSAALDPETNFNTTTSESDQFFSTSTDWTLFADEENQLYYIDFETLTFNVSDVIVKNEAGEVLLQDNVFDLPVDTIYELDFSNYQPGKYAIELRTFTEVVRKTVQVK